MDAVRATLQRKGRRLKLSEVQLHAPIRCPAEVSRHRFQLCRPRCRGRHRGSGAAIFFNKQSTCVVGPFDPFHLPRVSPLLDYEGELGVVIGRRCRHVPKERAHEVIAGYLVVNDVSVRDWQLRTPTMTMARDSIRTARWVPWLSTTDEIAIARSRAAHWVNGELRQHSNTRNLIFNCFDQMSTCRPHSRSSPAT